mgnify:CR=1 FL=1
MTNKTLLSHVIEYSYAHDYSTDQEDLHETFIECLSEGVVQDDKESEHYDYVVRTYVHKVTIDNVERYFKTFGYHIAEESSVMDLDMPKLSDVVEVHPREVLTVIYE